MKDCVFKLTILLIIIVFIVCLFQYYGKNIPKSYEGFVSGQCPTTLIKDGDKILLYNPDMVKVPGVNPIVFSCLKDYEKYIKWQRASGLNCPLLHLEQVYDSQGTSQYEIRNSFMENEPTGHLNHNLPNFHKPPCMEKLLDASVDNHKEFVFQSLVQNMYPSFDPYNQDIGKVVEHALN